MTDQQHFIPPPQDKVYKWWEEACERPSSFYEKLDHVAIRAAACGWQQRDASVPDELQEARDEKLDACCEWFVRDRTDIETADKLRAARRPKPLSPAALAVWEAFNREEPGVFVDYGDCLAAALRAAADQVVPYEATAPWDELKCDYDGDHWEMRQWVRDQLIAIADELEGQV